MMEDEQKNKKKITCYHYYRYNNTQNKLLYSLKKENPWITIIYENGVLFPSCLNEGIIAMKTLKIFFCRFSTLFIGFRIK